MHYKALSIYLEYLFKLYGGEFMISFYYYFNCKKSNMKSHILFKPPDHLTLMSMPGLLASSPSGKLQRAES